MPLISEIIDYEGTDSLHLELLVFYLFKNKHVVQNGPDIIYIQIHCYCAVLTEI